MFLYLAMIDLDTNKSKFEILYSEYKNLMYYTANRILRNSSDAEDVVHQAFLKVIEILDTISSPRCHKTRALLVTIT
ncbi:MAG: RNA polymerase sigma factor, partial [Butyricicoccus sp.]